MSEQVDGVELDGSFGSMLTLAMDMSLSQFIQKQNDPADPYRLNEHEAVTCGYQFSTGVTFLNITTPHLLLNLARAENSRWQKQGHFDGTFNLCSKDFGLIGFGMKFILKPMKPKSSSASAGGAVGPFDFSVVPGFCKTKEQPKTKY
jgi:hypothetical protein